MGWPLTCARLRAGGAGLLAAVVLSVTASAASGAVAPGGATLTDVQVTRSGVVAILSDGGAGGASIDPASVKATIGGVATPVSVRAVAQRRRVATLLIDTSGSMGSVGMQVVVRAADAFLAAVPKDVYVGVVAFSTVPTVVATPSLDRASVRTAVRTLTSRGETSLYDGLATTLAQLGPSGDRSFVLISDGGDTRSRRTHAQTLAALSASGVRAHVVGFKTGESQTSVLTSLAKAGHGSVAAASSGAAVSTAFVSGAAQSFGSQIGVNITMPPSAGGVRPLVVSGTAGAKAFSATAVVNLAVLSLPSPSAPPPVAAVPASVAHPPPAARSTGPLGMGWMLPFGLLAIFLGFGGVVAALLMPTFVSRHQRRVESIEGYVSDRPTQQDERSAVTAMSASLVGLGDKVMDSRQSTPQTQLLLERADLPLRAGEWAVLRAVAVVVGVAGGVILLHGGPVSMIVGLCLGGLVGFLLPAFFLKFAAARRAKKFESQLPDILTLVASSLSTGFSLLQALDAVARDADDPSAKEFSRALAETRIGADLKDSLDHLADRMDSKNLRWTGMAIDIQRQVGGNLAETLRTTAATLRDRQALHRHVRALSAEGKLSAYILIALPVGLFLYELAFNKSYVEVLWTSLIGLGLSAAGLISLGFGVFWMSKVVKVEV